MAIQGKTARACFDRFVGHLNELVQATLPTKVPLHVKQLAGREDAGTLGFRSPYTVELPTKRHGPVHLYLAQLLECTSDKKRSASERFRLSTRQYWYRLQTESGDCEPLMRWEYVSPKLPAYHEKRWCWRHLQMPHTVDLNKGTIDLNKVHLPTGYVVIEDVIRFLICELGAKPPCGKSWHDKLIESEQVFHRSFNAKTAP